MKRSKNKGRKKKAKQSKNWPIKLTEPIQEVQTQDATTITEKSSVDGGLEQTPTQPADVTNTEDTSAPGDDDQNAANKQTTGKKFNSINSICVEF